MDLETFGLHLELIYLLFLLPELKNGLKKFQLKWRPKKSFKLTEKHAG